MGSFFQSRAISLRPEVASTGGRTEPAVWGGAVIPALGRQRQEGHKFKVSLQGHSEFKDILDYVVSLRLSKRKRRKKKKRIWGWRES